MLQIIIIIITMRNMNLHIHNIKHLKTYEIKLRGNYE